MPCGEYPTVCLHFESSTPFLVPGESHHLLISNIFLGVVIDGSLKR